VDEARGTVSDCDFELVSAASAFVDSGAQRKAHIGVIVSQTNLVKSARFRTALVDVARRVTGKKEVIGIEMEGGGLAIGVKTQPVSLRPGLLMIKGAVDFANYQKNDAAQRKAAILAAEFVTDFLEYGPVASGRADEPASPRLTRTVEAGPGARTSVKTQGDYSPGIVHGNYTVSTPPRTAHANRRRTLDRTAGSSQNTKP